MAPSLDDRPLPANADAGELAKFQALAARWWDPGSEFRPLHEINPLRLDWIDAMAALAGKQAIDIGCGGGILAESMAARGARVTGIDLADKPLRVAELHGLESGVAVTYERIAAEAMAQRCPGQFDVVTCMEMLEHVPDPASTVRACATLARPGGWVFMSTINRNPKAFLFAIVGAEYVLNLLPKGTHEYEKFLRPAELSSYARHAGLDLVDMTGLTYNPITRRYRLSQADVSVNYLVAFRKPTASGQR
ncbi:MAG: bifunctional 2-polyprenyl-6-hydroxyphenol methylase/3-demethylubiquinol 3-O-methyltransferase UbiG [Burkholderiaceae bacterium]|nr:bifunctional 2-polyprenyl-6-hydroxyphenol methylase/3-demethylubiquinol 3-O-methyltransferase UbiG [Burkholderiaceae bacterium]MBP7660633.1 bifunctional 2-polyprenyl-6-hydroxyphenol methylase/3-demethylubiquinol 3-O-methyltransferase UbiG [Burkholderiaceae bacterium]